MNVYDLAYGAGLAATAPYWLLVPAARAKVLSALRQRRDVTVGCDSDRRCVLIHAVSLGEVNATRRMVQSLIRIRPDVRIIVSATTETGLARANELYAATPGLQVIRYPLDFSSSVIRLLESARPDLVVLLELELWPNFIRQCDRRGIPVVLVNGRLTSSAFRNYRLGGAVIRPMFRRLACACVQDEVYAVRFRACGVLPDRVKVTGTMKFDTADPESVVEIAAAARSVAAAVGVDPSCERVWVCGSTGPGEEPLVLEIYRDLSRKHPNLRLVLVPRKPERFDEVAAMITDAGFGLVRRSQTRGNEPPAVGRVDPGRVTDGVEGADGLPVVLVDTLGELRQFYAVAEVVFVGRTLVDLGPRQHGSDMIEPAALGKPVVVGPYTGNFADVMLKLRSRVAVVEVTTPAGLADAIAGFLSEPSAASEMGERARDLVRSEQGATARHVDEILRLLPPAGVSDGS